MTSVSHATAMYATKRRRRNSKNVRTVCSKDSHSKSNPSKRHRERLNQELDTLASLLPFESSVLSKLDKLSILRLSVSYLRTKSYFQAALASKRLLGNGAAGSLQQVPASTPHHNQHYHNQFGGSLGGQQLEPPTSGQQQHYPPELRLEGDLIVQALNGFLLILTCDGEVFYTSHTVETYLGFHQSDICHQSVYELVHSEDREELMQQLKWNSLVAQNSALTTTNNTTTTAAPTIDQTGNSASEQQKNISQMSLQEVLSSADHRHLLERNFTVRFRCLLDNTSGFLRLDIRGRIKVLHGQQNQQNLGNSNTNAACNKKQSQQLQQHATTSLDSQPMLAFFGVCVPFGPPSLLEMPSKDSVFKSKHRLDLSIISMDSRGKQLIGLTDLNGNKLQTTGDLSPVDGDIKPKLEPGGKSPAGSQSTNCKQQGGISAYDLVHHDDLSYMASAHQELLKTGASGLIAYRMIVQSDGGNKHQWLQTSAKLYYKNSKPDFILCTHRPLMEEEGRDLLGKRTMDFKVTYLDVGLSSINDRIMACDKFSSLQALERGGNSVNKSGSNQSRANRSPSTTGSTINGHHAPANGILTSSPALSAGESSRSLNSLSPQSSLATEEGRSSSKAGKRVMSNKQYQSQSYDLNSHQQYLGSEYDANHSSGIQYSALASTPYDAQHYKRSQNGDIFYDMDGSLDDTATRKLLTSSTGTNKKKTMGNKSSGKSAAKTNGAGHIVKKSKASLDHLASSNQQQLGTTELQSQQHAAVSSMDPTQLHLYSHYTNQHHHLHNGQEADPANAYPAIQAAAVYAASLGHSHPTAATASHHHQGPYASAVGNTVNQLSGYTHPHHNAMYGSASMVSPASSAAYAAHHHHQHHQHHSHLLDSASAANYHQSASHYGAFASAGHQQSSASSFLPAERLLHHYSQSARSAAALAAWQPTSGVGGSNSATSSLANPNSDYHQQNQNLIGGSAPHHQADAQSYAVSSSNTWGAAAAAAALAAGSSDKRSDTQDTYNSSHQNNSTTTDLYGQVTRNNTDNQHYQHHSQTHNNQQSMLGDSTSPVSSNKSRYSTSLSVHGQHHNDPMKSHGPASLSSDGSAHRSPLSSGESSNGSGSLTAAQAAAVAAASSAASLSTTDSSAMISPSTYYMPATSSQQQQLQHQHMQRNHSQLSHEHSQHQQSTYSHQQGHQQLAAYHHHHHHNPYSAAAAVAQQYSDTAASAAAAVQFNHYHHHHHQQMGSSAVAAEAAYFHHHHASASELAASAPNSGHVGASSAISAVKLYGANDQQQTPAAGTRVACKQDYAQQDKISMAQLDDDTENVSNDEVGTDSSDSCNDEDEDQGDGEDSSGNVNDHVDPKTWCNESTDESLTKQVRRDPLAQLISSTIGEIMLDITPTNND